MKSHWILIFVLSATVKVSSPIFGADEKPGPPRVTPQQKAEPKETPVSAPALNLASTNSPPAAAVSGKPPAKPVMVTLKDAQRISLGKPEAPLVLVEFTDYQCVYCRRFMAQTFPSLKRDYIDTGKLRFVSRNLPLKFHLEADSAALAVLTAAERSDDDYWKMRSWLYKNQKDLSPSALARYAADAGLDPAKILSGISTRSHATEIQEDLEAGRSVGITGTPSFVLGTSDGTNISGERIVGIRSFAYFKQKIQALLEGGTTPGTPDAPKSP